tara:strand:- start:1999 stop:3213 length:1215 start_codon:yes stop_codon:yes gene_type:complete
MHVFIITQYFPPEIGASASRWGDYSDILISQNHKVTILCETPHYPFNKYKMGYKNSWVSVESKSPNLTIIRSKAFASDRKSFIKKIIHYSVFMLSAIANSNKVEKFDILIISTPPLFTGIVGLFLNRFRNIDYFLDIRDLWPDSALELNQINKGFFYKLGKKLESKIYENASGFIIAVPSFKDYLKKFPSKISRKPMLSLVNGVSMNFYKKSHYSKVITDPQFTVLYSGNMGLAQDLETIIRAAKILQKYKIYFRFIGEGVVKSKIEQLAKPFLEKISFHKSMSRTKLINYIKKSSVCLVPLKDKKLFESALPSKMFEYMVCGKPVIASVRGDAKKFINNAKAGQAIDPEDPFKLSEAILAYYNDRNKCETDGRAGMSYVTENFSKEVLISKLLNELKSEQKII